MSLVLALVLAAAPCPEKKADSNFELKGNAFDRANCLKREMDEKLDELIVPLKKSDPARFKKWMAVQADYNRWTEDACALVEELFWVDFDERVAWTGTAVGLAHNECLQRLWADRYEFAAHYPEPWLDASDRTKGTKTIAILGAAKVNVSQVRKKPARTDPPAGAIPYGPKEWNALQDRLSRVLLGAPSIARQQCELSKPLDDCENKLSAHLAALVAIEER
jgi:hypothetical protein